MKKSILLSAFLTAALAVNAQTGRTALQGTGIWDNWNMEIKAGGITPLTHGAFFKNVRPAFGFGFGKQLTPVFGLGIQGMGYVNTTPSSTAFDMSDVSLSGKFNLMNLFGGYIGEPRVFELEGVTGIGWLHYYQNGPGDVNSWSTRFGLNLNFNLGEEKAWTFGIRPAIVYDMQGDYGHARSRFNVNNAAFELTAGLTYHFMGSNGSRHFTNARVYDYDEIAALNGTINDLRSEVSSKESEAGAAARRADALQRELEACRREKTNVQTVVKTNRIPETIVTFRQGSSTIDASQQPNVERIASYMNKHPQATVVIKGYASPEGKLAFNERLARSRAEAVKNLLVKKYRIDARRITAEGQGIGNMFSEADWNRVSICTLDESR